MCEKPSIARSGARKSCETEYENASSSLLDGGLYRFRPRAFGDVARCHKEPILTIYDDASASLAPTAIP
jgi:hypothetical protein